MRPGEARSRDTVSVASALGSPLPLYFTRFTFDGIMKVLLHERVRHACDKCPARTTDGPLPAQARPRSSRARAAVAEPPEMVKSEALIAPDNVAALAALRAEMKAAGDIAAYIVPSEDPHMSEYPPDCCARRQYISGFTGSAGTVVVTQDAALLWTDGRYYLQGEKQLGEGWTLMRGGSPGVPELPAWLAENLPEGAKVGVDPFVHTLDGAATLEAALHPAGKTLVPVLPDNLVDKCAPCHHC